MSQAISEVDLFLNTVEIDHEIKYLIPIKIFTIHEQNVTIDF